MTTREIRQGVVSPFYDWEDTNGDQFEDTDGVEFLLISTPSPSDTDWVLA